MWSIEALSLLRLAGFWSIRWNVYGISSYHCTVDNFLTPDLARFLLILRIRPLGAVKLWPLIANNVIVYIQMGSLLQMAMAPSGFMNRFLP